MGTYAARIAFFVAVAGLCSYVPDTFLVSLLEDDRVCRRLGESEASVLEEVEFVCGIEDSTWQALADAIGCSPMSLRSKVVGAAHIAAGFLTTRVFVHARSYPWSLCQGDIMEQLEHLHGLVEAPSDATACKIWRLLRMGFSKSALVDALKLMASVSWSTTVTEQGHAQASSLRKAHQQYGAETLVTRAMLGAMKPLMSRTPHEKRMHKLQHRLETLGRYTASHIGARQVFLKDMVESSTFSKNQGRILNPVIQKHILKNHGRLWKKQSLRMQQVYAHRAALLREVRLQQNMAEMQHIRDRVILDKERWCKEEKDGQPLRLSSCRLSSQQLAQFDEMYLSDDFSSGRVQQLRNKAQEPFRPPSETIQAALHECADPPGAAGPPRPDWWSGVCWGRQQFSDTVWRFSADDGGEARLLKFVYATQSPMHICFQSCTAVLPELPDMDGSSWESCAMRVWEHNFEVQPMRYVFLKDMQHFVDRSIHVLSSCVFLAGHLLVSDASWKALSEHLEGPALSSSFRGDSGAFAARPSKDVIASHPWLADFMELSHKQSSKRKGGDSGRGLPLSSSEASSQVADEVDVELDSVFGLLSKKRAELFEQGPVVASHFKVSLLGGAWTQKHLDVPFDAIQGRASGFSIEQFCVAWGFQKSMRFSLSAYGEAAAHQLAQTWCAIMQHWYDMAAAGGPEFVFEVGMPPWRATAEFEDLERHAEGLLAQKCAQLVELRPRALVGKMDTKLMCSTPSQT